MSQFILASSKEVEGLTTLTVDKYIPVNDHIFDPSPFPVTVILFAFARPLLDGIIKIGPYMFSIPPSKDVNTTPEGTLITLTTDTYNIIVDFRNTNIKLNKDVYIIDISATLNVSTRELTSGSLQVDVQRYPQTFINETI
jgi:hypothetical protein